jgi:hypothetical protein
MNWRRAHDNSDDPDALALAQRYPKLTRIGERMKIESGPLAGEPVVVRRRLTERDSVLFALRYDDGQIREFEWVE